MTGHRSDADADSACSSSCASASSDSGLEERSDSPSKEKKNSRKMDLAFSGAGFMGCYYFGVVDCWRKYVPLERINRVAGTSAGSLIAAYYLMDMPLSNSLKEITNLIEGVRKQPLGVFNRSNQIVDSLPKMLDQLFPGDAHKRVSGKLFVCMTRLKDMKKILVNEFESKKDLIDALNCSCFIPVWSGSRVPTFRGVKHIDGGFSDQLPAFDARTIRICCFSGQTEISPYDKVKSKLLSSSVINMPVYFNFANCRRGRRALFPPTPNHILSLLENGFNDAKDFILSNDLIQCDECFDKMRPEDQPIYSRPSPCITPSVTPRSLSPAPQRRMVSAPAITKPQRPNHLLPNPEVERFGRALSAKLDRYSEQDTTNNNNNNAIHTRPDLNNNSGDNAHPPPMIVISSEDQPEPVDLQLAREFREAARRRQSLAAQVSSSASVGSKKAGGARRNTAAQLQPFAMQRERFSLVPNNPLPSCPPSPNLNRHCTKCLSMRQEARNDLLAENLRAVAMRALEEAGQERQTYNKSKLGSPLRWIRQLRTKTSYDFDRAAEFCAAAN